MKKCPYCAESIQDEAIKCRYCGSNLGGEAGLPPPSDASVGAGAIQFSHSGRRFLLGYGADFFGIWDRNGGGGPVRRFPRTDAGWEQAWLEYRDLEPESVPVAVSSAPRERGASRETGSGRRPVSGLWWILPILFSLVGGLIAWAATRDRDPTMARNMLLTGAAISALGLIVLALRPG